MLVLTRKKGEKVRLKVKATTENGESVEVFVTVVNVNRNRVRLGFEAPKDAVSIARTEILQKKEAVDCQA